MTGRVYAIATLDTKGAELDYVRQCLAAAGAPVPAGKVLDGESLVPLLGGRDGATLTRPIALDTGRRLQALVDRDGLKVMRNVRAGTFEAYDLIADPGEKENLYGKRDLTDAFGRLTEFFVLFFMQKPAYEIPFRD